MVSLPRIFPLDGGCDCRYVRYRMTKAPLFVHCCHCRWCQRETGSAFVLNAMIEAELVQLLGAEPEMIDTPSASGRGQKIARCRGVVLLCGVITLVRGRSQFVRVGTLTKRTTCARYSYLHRIQQPGRHSPRQPSVPEYYDREKYWRLRSSRRLASCRGSGGPGRNTNRRK